ncbi:DUF72 domain-containing protein [Ktedonosporobacter rubrisoli]|uniref:DUF72 domain-containing protein n=1 Tax=Ktedonosporobacter rubrisoli TaxID=2509675 RepID=A0A4V0YZ20_KTERU|nr:DUF72 domain-containing protein [Ktedonosporobacter rubrisoli]QBD78191.1 DUF72 domain-containing protein [Ktedonosporobacter rubrisoli]
MTETQRHPSQPGLFYIGCPMWGYKEWVGRLFPARTPASEFLRLYSRILNSVEGNTTFYAIPSAETVRRWSQETPSTFRFCPKIPRSISHAPSLSFSQNEILFFAERMRLLGSRLGPIFLQLPPTFTPTRLPELQAFLDFWPTDIRLAVEVRHPEFFSQPYSAQLDELLSKYQVSRIMLDTRPIRTGPREEQQTLQARERKPDLPLHLATTTDFVFVRYIGHPRMPVNQDFLAAWSRQLAQWLTQGITLYIFCHCPYEEHSPSICAALYDQLKKLTPLPALPWPDEKARSQPEQARLFE